MSSKSTPTEVIEVPDDDPDDFPNSGPQNPAEAQSYRDKIDDIMETFGQPLGWWPQGYPEVYHHILEETNGEALATDGRGWCRVGYEVNPWPQLHLPLPASLHWRHWHDKASDRNSWGVDLHQAAVRKGVKDRGLGIDCDMLWSPVRGTHSHVIICAPTCHPWPRFATLRPLTWWWKQLPDWWFRSMSWSLTWVWCKILPPKMTTEERLTQLEKVLLTWVASLAWEPQFGPTQLLAAAIWLCLKHKFFNGGMAKEVCITFEVWAKQLSKATVR